MHEEEVGLGGGMSAVQGERGRLYRWAAAGRGNQVAFLW
jgi:hypothetical protein